MIDCLTGYIGLASVAGTAPSGLYLDALPDINLSNTVKIADGEQTTAENVWADVEKRSILKFRTFFTTELNRCFRVFKRDKIDCLICENMELFAVALWYLMGSEMLEERLGSNRVNRFTTVDRQKTKELQANFMDVFFRELQTAVAGIDMDGSACFSDEKMPECGGDVRFMETCP